MIELTRRMSPGIASDDRFDIGLVRMLAARKLGLSKESVKEGKDL
jgi:hypothetical protein